MRLFNFIVVCALVFFIIGTSLGQGFELKEKEELVYSASFMGFIPIGNVDISVKGASYEDGKRVYNIQCLGKTPKWLSLLFKAEAAVGVHTLSNGLYPIKFEQILKIAGRPDDIRRAAYDRENNIMAAEGKGRKKVPADVRDPISAIYYLRTQDLKEGAQIKQMVNSNQSTYIFNSKVTGKKRIGRFNCWVLDSKIRRENKSMYHSMDAVLYISDDGRRLPVLIQAKTKVGPVTLRLKE